MKKQMLLKDLTVGMEFEALGHKFVLLVRYFMINIIAFSMKYL